MTLDRYIARIPAIYKQPRFYEGPHACSPFIKVESTLVAAVICQASCRSAPIILRLDSGTSNPFVVLIKVDKTFPFRARDIQLD
jgi:hypothetical protein